ncbi:leucine-rich repeat serine/threonine-protein kinase 2 [Microcaecilia unicolor]|uniref:non-specific serine/threonine protein kinase n=1 Tax=Microcaecilia unicolor TaxID=1415580 RepID=A0A6P7ZAU5_9AMPH|nr:leucine-rich repeat serine/threonine-protein kinase 2 [Microcaecilia unicolor]
MASYEELEESLKKLIVRLKNFQEGKPNDTLIQIIEDMFALTFADCAPKLFEGMNVHLPLLLALELYMNVAGVQQVGWSFLCKLIEVYPLTLDKLAAHQDLGKDWEVIGVHQLILKMLCIHSTSENLLVVGLKTLNVLLTSDVITYLLLDEELDIFVLLFEALKNFSENADIQKYGCQALQLLFEKVPEEQLTEFVDTKDHMIVLNALKIFEEKEDVIVPALCALLPLAGSSSNAEVLMSGNVRCYNVIINLMMSFPSNEKIQEVSCCLFQKLTLENFFNILVLNYVHEVIMAAVGQYPLNAKLQAAGLSCLALLTESIYLNKDLEEMEEEEGANKQKLWLGACYEALKQHRKNIDVQEAACWALNNLFMYQRDLHAMVGDGDKQYPIHREVMLAILNHFESKEVFQAAANTLATLSEQDVNIRSILLAKGIHMNVLDIMKKYPKSPEVAESTCKILNQLFKGSLLNLDVLTVTLSGVINCMKRYENFHFVQLEALRVMLHFAVTDAYIQQKTGSLKSPEEACLHVTLKVIKNQCLLEGAHILVLNTLNKFLGNPAIQECGLKILCSIAECSGAPELISQQGGTDTVLHTLQMYPDDPGIQCLGLSLLGYLVTRKSLCKETMQLLSSFLVSTLQRYKDIIEVQKHGLNTILVLLELSHSFAKLLERESFDTVLFYQISICFTEKRDVQFQVLCCRCFAEMIQDDDIKNKLLEKACMQSNSMVVECLLLLKADVNRKTKKNSLIYQVCEKGNEPKLVELLLNYGAREQDVHKALAISIKRGQNQIISLLLKKLGLDLTNHSICLGGFRMGRVEPSWLLPLFPDKMPALRKQPNTGPALARVVLRYQTKKALLDEERSSDDVNDVDTVLEKADDCILMPELSEGGLLPCNDVDSEGSDGSFSVKRKSSSIANVDLCGNSPKMESIALWQRHSRSVGPGGDCGPSRQQQKKAFSSDMSPKRKSVLRRSDSSSSLNAEKESVKSLDLSANELENIDSISQNCCLTLHLNRLEKLELQQNALTDFPEELSKTLKCLTHLDLHSNRVPSFPSYILDMHCITYLDVSRNDIGPSLDLAQSTRCPALKHLNLSYNQLTVIPDFLGDVTEKLEELILEGNKISEIHSPLRVTELRLLNISKNNMLSLAEDFLTSCTKLEVFNAAVNLLDALPRLPFKIMILKLSQNKFTIIPEEILHLPHLRSVDLCSNRITELSGPAHWESLNLRELLFSCNQIGTLNMSVEPHKWARLEKLHLSHNMLKKIPPEIGFLENITSLDVSYNPDLRSFPDEMGKLSKVWDLPLDGLHLDLDLKHIGCKARDIIRFLQQRLKKAVPYNRMKLMIVGNTGSGKTVLVQQLMKCKLSELGPEKSTVGIDVKDWLIQPKGKVKRELLLNVWDFAGQEEFYSSHPHFMTQRALYVVVFNLSKGAAEVDAIKPWLFNIKARASSSPVILVGTHLDGTDERCRKACLAKIQCELLNRRGFPAIQGCHFVNAKEESDSLAKLRETIIKESLNFKIRDQPVVGQLIPDSYLELEKRILHERKKVPAEFPVIDHKRLLELVQESQLPLDENELSHAIRFLNESGVLLHFEDPALQLRDLYFVDPQWLCKIMAQILTVKAVGFPRRPRGIIQCSVVEKLLSQKSRFPKNYMSQYFKLLEKFQIALPSEKDNLLIPSSLSDHRPVIELSHCENSEVIIRLYEMPYFPMGLWSRLINRLLEISSYMLSGREKALYPSRMYWRQGIYLNWSPEAYCLVESAVLDNNPDSFLKITVPCGRKGCILLGQVVDHIDSIMEEWFPGLLETDVCGEGETLLKKWALYSFEDGQEHQKILLDDLLKKADEGDLLVSPGEPKLTIPISQIAPDLVLADLPRNIMLNSEELELDQSPEFLLGDGGFGSVYRASYQGDDVAVKIFNRHTSPRLLRQELTVLSHLHHPSLVSLLAAGVRPRMLVMELAPKGSLDHMLQQDSTSLTRTLQHRIALHIADGLRYLHSAMIIYRDLKPHNVLLFTFYPNAAVIAKIADYGIAQYCCRMGIKTSEGTPGFRAPEVAKGNVIYNQQADVYSFGLLLYDILTAGARLVESIKFPNEFDELAVHGKLPDPVREYNCSPWPEVENLIKKCLKENPQERPTSAQVYDMLESTELLCLMRNIPVPSVFTAECMVPATHSYSQPAVWVGNGCTDKAELSCLNLKKGGHTCKLIIDSRILCLALVSLPEEKENWILAGTQSGLLLTVNAENMKSNHHLQKMSDSVTSLYCSCLARKSKEKNFVLVGTADGNLAVFEDTSIRHEAAAPLKILRIGNVNTPLVCLCESLYLSDKYTIWGGCGTKIVSFSSNFSLQKVIDTKTSQLLPQKSFSDANIVSIAVDNCIYLAKKNSHFVEVWDKKTDKCCELIDCAHFLKDELAKRKKQPTPDDAYAGRVKTILLQRNTALWIGTGGGHILLIDLSTRHPIRIIVRFCDSIRSMMSTQLDKGSSKNIVLILGCHNKTSGVKSFFSIWDANLPHEVQNLKKHIEMRKELTEKLRNRSIE